MATPILRRTIARLAIPAVLLAVASCAEGGGSAGPVRADLRIVSVSGTSTAQVPSGAKNPYAIAVIVTADRRSVRTPFRVGLYLSSDDMVDPVLDTFVEGKILSVLQKGEEVTLDFRGEFPPSFPGLLRVGAYADDDPPTGVSGSIPETDEWNNWGIDPQPLEVFPTTPPPPTVFLAEDTAIFQGTWVTEGAIRLKWDAVPEAFAYNLYRDTAPITSSNPGTRVNPDPIPGPSRGAGWNIQGYIDGTSQTNQGATLIPTNDGTNLPAGIYHYKVFSVDGIGVESTDGPELIADHASAGYTPEDVLFSMPGLAPPSVEVISTLTPTFVWTAGAGPANWSFRITEPVTRVDPVWVYFGFAPGQSVVSLPYGAVGDFTARGATPLRNDTVYSWMVVGYDANGWGYLQSKPVSIQTPP